jgi:IclR helix-turn-helix domain
MSSRQAWSDRGVARSAPGPQRSSISIELSQAQLASVLRDASAVGGNSPLVLSGLSGVRDVLASAPEHLDDPRLSRSLLLGLLMLCALPADGSYTGLTVISRTLGMSMSTAHRYASTLLAAGLLERDPATRQYRLACVA